MADFALGLIGDNIKESRAPDLHRRAGVSVGLDVAYDLLIPKERGQDFPAVFAEAARTLRGVNITLPYKERAVALATVDDPMTRAMAAINTVIFAKDGPQGFNTDYSGFVAAYRAARDDAPPGVVCQMGAGGVGKAVAFGLVTLGAAEIRLVERDLAKAAALAAALKRARPEMAVSVGSDSAAAAKGADGLINCTPLGMSGYGGTPLAGEAMAGAAWAFDAVYTPLRTTFLDDAAAAGLHAVSGYELFLHQGADAFRLFTGHDVDANALRAALA